MLLNGGVAFLLNVAVVLLIGHTSALVMTLAGIVKDILLVALSMLLFGSPVTPLQYGGYGLALLGLNLHKEYKKSPERVANLLALCCKAATSGGGSASSRGSSSISSSGGGGGVGGEGGAGSAELAERVPLLAGSGKSNN